MSEQARAIGLVSSPDFRAELEALLPSYAFHWELPLRGCIQLASDLRPAFLLVDTADNRTGWREIVLALNTNPATRRIPLIGISTATGDEALAEEEETGLFQVLIPLTRLAELPQLSAQHARHWDDAYYSALRQACSQALPPAAQEGIRLFNAQEYWEAHEALEQAWIAAEAPLGDLYRAILQVGVAYYQIQQQNYRGALKMFLRAVQWLDPLPEQCQGIDLAQFKRDAAAARRALEALTPETIDQFDTSLFKALPMIQV